MIVIIFFTVKCLRWAAGFVAMAAPIRQMSLKGEEEEGNTEERASSVYYSYFTVKY